MTSANEAPVRDLVARHSELAPDLAEHLDDNFGEVLPHVLLADVMRRVELHEGGQPDGAGAIRTPASRRTRWDSKTASERPSAGCGRRWRCTCSRRDPTSASARASRHGSSLTGAAR